MHANSPVTSAPSGNQPTSGAVPASATSRRLSQQARKLQFWNRIAMMFGVLILLYAVGCLVLVEAPVDQPQLPGLMAGFGVVPLLGLSMAYLLTRAELTRR